LFHAIAFSSILVTLRRISIRFNDRLTIETIVAPKLTVMAQILEMTKTSDH